MTQTLTTNLNTPSVTRFGRVYDFLSGDADDSIAVATTGTVYTEKLALPKNSTFGWEVQFSSSGTVAVTVVLEQSMDGTTWVTPDNKTTELFPSVADTSVHQTSYAPNATPYGRLKLTGTGSNDASTALVRALMYAVNG